MFAYVYKYVKFNRIYGEHPNSWPLKNRYLAD